MDQRIKALWIKDLLSGEYLQGVGALAHESDGAILHCCLGVLCETLIRDGRPIAKEIVPDSNSYQYGYQSDLPNVLLLQSIGIDFGEAQSLSEMNDNGASFAEIAEHIEENF